MDNKKATLELGTKPVGKLLVQYALPAIIAMTASSLYNMIDSIFIGQGCGPLAISGLAITFPFQNLAAAFRSRRRSRSRNVHLRKTGTERLCHGTTNLRHQHHAEPSGGHRLQHHHAFFPQSYPPLLRSQQGHAALRTRIHGSDTRRQRHPADVLRTERCAACCQQAKARHGSVHALRAPQRHPRPHLHLALGHGHPWSSLGYGDIAVGGAGLAMPTLQQQE